MVKKTLYFFIIVGLTIINGCGFHLRGSYNIPEFLKRLEIIPTQSMDPFQRMLKRVLMSNGIELIQPSHLENTDSDEQSISTLTILHQDFQEQALAYALDGQLKRARLSLQIEYQLDTKTPQKSIQGQVRVSRELDIEPNNILSTDHERQRLKNDLSTEAALQLVFQLSMQYDSSAKTP